MIDPVNAATATTDAENSPVATDPFGAGEPDVAVGNGTSDSVADDMVEGEGRVAFDVP